MLELRSGVVIVKPIGAAETRLSFSLDGVTESDLGLRVEVFAAAATGGRSVEVTLSSSAPVTLCALWLEAGFPRGAPKSALLSGYQSWTESRRVTPGARLQPMRWPLSRIAGRMSDDEILASLPRRGDVHSFGHTLLEDHSGDSQLVGSLDEATGYTVLSLDWSPSTLRIYKDCGGLELSAQALSMRLFISEGGAAQACFEAWILALKLPVRPARTQFGWTSWYYHYTSISEDKVKAALASYTAEGLPLDLFQIDDGYQRALGDWLETNRSFPGGMAAMAQEIRAAGLVPGLWLAPFVCQLDSQLAREHPGWLVRDRAGRPLSAGVNPLWGGRFYTLDVTQQGFRDHLRATLDTIIAAWGYGLVKLDFLYAAAIRPTPQRTRGALMCEALDLLRDCIGDRARSILCGVPMSAALGRADLCRVGADISHGFETWPLRFMGVRERLSTVSALRSIIARRHLDGHAWLADPDVIMLRRERCRMSSAQKLSLLRVALVFGRLIFCSDDPARYGPEQRSALRSIFPLPRIEDLEVREEGELSFTRFTVNGRLYELLLNLCDAPRQAALEARLRYCPLAGLSSSPLELRLGPGESRLFYEPDRAPFTLLGGDGHAIPGADLQELRWRDGELSIERHPQARAGSELLLRVPTERCLYEGRELIARLGARGYRLTIELPESPAPPVEATPGLSSTS